MGKNNKPGNRFNPSDDLEDDLELGTGLELGVENAETEETGLDLEPVSAESSEAGTIITGSVLREEDIQKEVDDIKVNDVIDKFIENTEKAMEQLEGGNNMTEGFAGNTGAIPGFGTDTTFGGNAPEGLEKAAPLNAEVKTEAKPDTKAAGKTTGFYIPKNYKVEKAVTKETMKEADKAKINVVLEKELTGTGESEVSGQIDVHIKVAAIEAAIRRLVGKVKEEAEKIGGVKPEIFDNFLANIIGVSSTLSYDAGQLPLTAANYHREATAKILADNQNMQQAQAASKAAEVVSGYIGKNIEELKNAANSMPVKFLTLVVKRQAIPQVNGKDDKNAIDLITNCFTSEFVKSIIADKEAETLHIAISMSRIFKYAQGHFKQSDLEDISMIASTIISNNNSTHSVVYRINKKSSLQK